MGRGGGVAVGVALTVASLAVSSPVTPSQVRLKAPQCKISGKGGKIIDFALLGKSSGDYGVVSQEWPSFEYGINICRGTATPESAVCNTGTSVCERHRLTHKAVANYGEVDELQLTWVGDTVVMNMTGEPCVANPAQMLRSVLTFSCQASAAVPVFKLKSESAASCMVEFAVNTDIVCNVEPGPPGPSPPPPPPPPADKYVCEGEKCVVSKDGTLSKDECEKQCVPVTYKCENSRCIAAEGGVSKEKCEEECKPDTYKCIDEQCVFDQGGGSREQCLAICEKPESKYKCQGGKCVASTSGVTKDECEQVCNSAKLFPIPVQF